MPQLQLPIFSRRGDGDQRRIAVQKDWEHRYGTSTATCRCLQHEESDVRSFRMFTSQMIAGGTRKTKEIVNAFACR